MLTGAIAQGSLGYLSFDLQPSSARYVKIVGQGNSVTSWNSITEVQISGCEETNTPTSGRCNRMDNLAIDRATSPDSHNQNYSPSRAIDNNLGSDSRWSSKGSGRSITLELSERSTVRRIATAWHKGDIRQAFFDVRTSTNNQDWQTVLSQATAQGTRGMIEFDVLQSDANFVQIIGYGNSASPWNSIVEVDVFGCGERETVDTPPTSPPSDNSSIERIRTLFDLEGGDNDLTPYRDNNTLAFNALAARHVTPNGNGWRHELKIRQSLREAMYETIENFSARITPRLSPGSKTIVAQYHGGDTGTLVKVYVSDTDEKGRDDVNPADGVFAVYVRLRTDSSDSETILDLGTIRSGDSFNLTLNNNRGDVFVSALGKSTRLRVSNSDGAYLKFGNYLQAQEPAGGRKYSDDDDWADFYNSAGFSESVVTFSNISYNRN